MIHEHDTETEVAHSVLAPLENEDPAVLDLVTGKNHTQLTELAHDFFKEKRSIEYRLGGLFYHIKNLGEYRHLKPEYAGTGGFGRFIQDEFSIAYRKAQYFITIYVQFNRFEGGAELVDEIGWSKAAKIAALTKSFEDLSSGEFENMIDIAKNTAASELDNELKKIYSADSIQNIDMAKFKGFKVPKNRSDIIEKFLEEACHLYGTDNHNEVMENIITDWAEYKVEESIKRR